MTGYLKSLALRTVDDTPVLSPRLPSQFEPNSYALAQTSIESLHHGDDQSASENELTSWKSPPADIPNSNGSYLPTSQADKSQVPLAQETQRKSNQREPRQDFRLTPRDEQTDGKISSPVNSQRGTERKPRQYSPALTVRSNEESDEGTAAPPLRFEHADVKRPIVPSVEPEVVRRKTKRPTGDDRSQTHRTELDFAIEDSRQGNSAQTNNVNLQSTRQILAKPSPTSAAESKTNAPDVLVAQQPNESNEAARSILPMPAIESKAMGQRDNTDKSDMPGQKLSLLHPQSTWPVQPKAIQPILPIQQQIRSVAAVQRPQIVNVTIGRIEIKALPVDERPRKRTQNRSSAMSLDEYLNQHAMGSNQ